MTISIEEREAAILRLQSKESHLSLMSGKFRDDREVVLEAVRQNAYALQFASEDLRSDLRIVKSAYLENTGVGFLYASGNLRWISLYKLNLMVKEEMKNRTVALTFMHNSNTGRYNIPQEVGKKIASFLDPKAKPVRSVSP